MGHYLETTNRAAVWNEYAPSQVQIGLPTEIIDAMVFAGFLQTGQGGGREP